MNYTNIELDVEQESSSEVTIMDVNELVDMTLYAKRGQAKVEICEYKSAIADFTHSIEICDIKSAQIYYSRGIAYYNIKEYEKALLDVNKALELEKDYEDARNLREKIKEMLTKDSSQGL